MINLLSTERLSVSGGAESADKRKEFDRDFDRILFSAPVRRLADKTQVFPMETNDSVRTRLTHSHEVSNLCRSLSLQILRDENGNQPFGPGGDIETVPVIAAAAGLAHDLGNPPFGHKGETAIRDWFHRNERLLFSGDGWKLMDSQRQDFLKWEGNAQAFRLVTRLQVSKGNSGLNLTVASLAALMKYTVASDETEKNSHPSRKKFGYFQDDAERAVNVLNKVGLSPGQRHPIAYVMEACDDIAYSTIDIEDAVNKGIFSLNDVLSMLALQKDTSSKSLCDKVNRKLEELKDDGRSIPDIRDIGLQYFRSFAISEMVVAARATFLENNPTILSGSYEGNLVEKSSAGMMCKALKDFAFQNAFLSPKVTALELRGANVMHKLMDYLWRGINEIGVELLPQEFDREKLKIPKATMFGRYAFNCISTNYIANFQRALGLCKTPEGFRYQQLLLLSDMVSGMTEDFVHATFAELRELDDQRGNIAKP